MPQGLASPRTAQRPQVAQTDVRFASEPSRREQPAIQLQLGRSLRMHPVLAGVVSAAVLLLVVGFALTRKPVYTAESLVYVEPLEQRVLSDGSGGGAYDAGRYDSYLQQQVQTVEREDTLEAALAKMPPGVWTGPGEPTASAVRRLESSLKVDRVLNSYQLGIDVTANTAVAAADAANAITQAYLEEGRKDEHARADQRLQLLNEERGRITDDMAQDKTEQASLATSLGVANPNGEGNNPYDLQTVGLRTQLDAAREAHDAVAAQLASVSGTDGAGLAAAANELTLSDPGLVSIKQTLSQRRAVLTDQMAGLTPANPAYKQDQEEIANIDRSLDRANADARARAERQLQEKLRLDLRRTADVEGRLNAQLAQDTAKATGAGPKLQRAAELQTDLQRLSARYAAVDDAIRGLQLETGGPGQAHLALAARVPDAPKASRTRLLLLAALPLALFCGLTAAVIARKRDRRLYIASDLEEVLAFEPMCVLPSAHEVSAAAYDDFLLRLAGAVEGAYRQGNARSFVFTPVSVSGSGEELLPKLCVKLQQIGFRAGCVDAASLLPSNDAASDARDEAPTGNGPVVSQLEKLRGDNDVVLVTAPPLLGSALAEYAVRCADATVLLVQSTQTTRADLQRAAALLERLGPEGIGAVLEDLPLRLADPAFREAVDHAGALPLRRAVAEPQPADPEPATPPTLVEPLTSVQVVPPASATVVEQEWSVPAVPPASVANTDPPLELVALRPEPQEAPGTTVLPKRELVDEFHAAPMDDPSLLTAPDPVENDRWDWQTPVTPADPPAEALANLVFREQTRAEPARVLPLTLDVPAVTFQEMQVSPQTQEATLSEEHALEEPDTAVRGEAVQVPAFGQEHSWEHLPNRSLDDSPTTEEENLTSPLGRVSGWLRRLFGIGDEPNFKITPADDAVEESSRAEHRPLAPLRAVVETDPSELEFAGGHGTALAPPSLDESSMEREDIAFAAPSMAAGATFAAERTPAAASGDAPQDAVPSTAVAVEDRLAPVVPMLAHLTEHLAEPAKQRDIRLLPPDPVADAVVHELHVEAAAEPLIFMALSDQADSATVPVTTRSEPDEYKGGDPQPTHSTTLSSTTFSRARVAPPLTVDAIPGMVSSVGSARSAAADLAPAPLPIAKPAAVFVPAPADTPWPAEGRGAPVLRAPLVPPAPPQRAGLAKAAAQVSVEEGPPARASEGLSAMRKAGLRKAVVRQEAVLRGNSAAPRTPEQQPGMSRRWAMLSRFERSDATEAQAAPKDGALEEGSRRV